MPAAGSPATAAQTENFEPKDGVYAKKNGNFAEAARLRDYIFFADWGQVKNLAANGGLKVGATLELEPVPGYKIKVSVSKEEK